MSEKGRFREKHPYGAAADPEIARAVQRKVLNGQVTCADAESVAGDLLKPLPEVGVVLDILDMALTSCQLGLFGYAPQKSIVEPAKFVRQEIESAINARLINGRLSCAAAWEIAAALGVPKIKVSAACEALKIKIKPCQLGAF